MTSLFEDAAAVDQLLRHPGFEIIGRLVAADVAEIDSTLNGRLLDTHAEYARLTGRRGGLGIFEATAHALVAEAEKVKDEQARKHESTSEHVA